MPQFENPTRGHVIMWMLVLIFAFAIDSFLCLFEKEPQVLKGDS